ncbi:MAG: class I SAM-dependent methyltransferase [Saprospirales bacterium]|nr:class I SAM-dependent methyltransferase [Saprospirales bacterium]
MAESIEKVLPPTTDTQKSKGVDSVTSKAEEMDYCYTVPDKIFQLSLGKNAHFSNARYMGDYSMSLQDAQTAKCKYVADMLGLAPGKRVIDLGCGWGGWLRYVKDTVGAEGVGVTLSRGQAKHNQETGLAVHHMDMREVKPDTFGPFDAATAFGSFEHLCSYEEYLEGKQMDIYRRFFEQVRALIPVGGRFYMQTMTFGRRIKEVPRENWDINAPKDSDEYTMALMVKQFPLSWVPYMDESTIEAAQPHFKLIEHSSGRLDYVKTNQEWTRLYKKFNLVKYWYYMRMIPKYIFDPEFRYMLDILRYAPNRRCFERELFDHFRYVFERVD